MKYIILIISVLILFISSITLKSQDIEDVTDETKNKSSKLVIVASAIGNLLNRNYNDKSIGGHLSLRYNSADMPDYLFFCLNSGYIHYKDNKISKNDYTITLGTLNDYNLIDNVIINTGSVEFGIIYKDIESKKC